MESPVRAVNHRIHFRTFELDLRTRELYRKGTRLKVQGQPIDVLEMLLEHPGELVRREELRNRLWPEDTFVDFEHSLNSTIKRLRDALGDDADKPRYIETLPRLGYRFIAGVEQGETGIEEAPPSLPAPDAGSDPQPIGTLSFRTPLPEPGGPGSRSWFRMLWWSMMMTATLLVSAVSGAYWYLRQPLQSPHIGEIRQVTQDGRWRWKLPVGADGERVYFAGRPSGLYAVGSSGEIEIIPLDLPWPPEQGVSIEDVSPDGSYVLARPETGPEALWVFTTTGKPVRYVASGERINGVWSPDGEEVTYSASDGKVYAIPAVSGEPRFLFPSNNGMGRFFSFSPDGKRIRYTYKDKIWEMRSDGSDVHEFLPRMKDSVAKCCGRWTPDGAFYVFASQKKKSIQPFPGASQLWALDERSGTLRKPNREPVQLTFDPMQWNFPVISRDSRTIFATGTVRQGELVRYDTQTGEAVPYMGGISADWLTFSPDGKYVAYVSYPERKVWRANRDGSGRILLADPPQGAWGVRWSPDGTRILFVADRSAGADQSDIYILPAEGGTAERVQLPEGEAPVDPTWSPDGMRLAYTVDYSYPDVTPNGIRILDLETHRSTALPTAPVPLFGPRWSPDGRYIFCQAEPSAGSVFFDTEKQKWTYFPMKIDWTFGNWAHDSRSVYVLGAKTPLAFDGVYRVWVQNGHTERVVDLANVRLAGSKIGYWLGLDPEDHPLLLRDAGSVELYALTLERK